MSYKLWKNIIVQNKNAAVNLILLENKKVLTSQNQSDNTIALTTPNYVSH